MSTVDLQSAQSAISGMYKEDGFDSIIIYGTMFGNIAFKLCRGRSNLDMNVRTFQKNNWPHMIGWTAEDNSYGAPALKEFNRRLEIFKKSHGQTHKLQDF